MASLADKHQDNVPGPFYTDSQCINCDLCRQTAPDFFARNDDAGYSYVCKQPGNDAETALVQQAMDECPVEAIGNDGK